jgi:hypothetical protein
MPLKTRNEAAGEPVITKNCGRATNTNMKQKRIGNMNLSLKKQNIWPINIIAYVIDTRGDLGAVSSFITELGNRHPSRADNAETNGSIPCTDITDSHHGEEAITDTVNIIRP